MELGAGFGGRLLRVLEAPHVVGRDRLAVEFVSFGRSGRELRCVKQEMDDGTTRSCGW